VHRYATFCELAGVNSTDTLAQAAGLPPIDSVSQWEYLSSLAPGATAVPPPRTIMPLGSARHFADDASGAVIRTSDHIKLIYGPTICEDIWTSPVYPNATWGLDDLQAASATLLDYHEVDRRFSAAVRLGEQTTGATFLVAEPCSGNRSQLWQLSGTASKRSAGSTITQLWGSKLTRCWRHGCGHPTGIKLAEQVRGRLP
jgi:hypothetical protein